MSSILCALGLLINTILPDLTIGVAANIIYDISGQLYKKLTIIKGRDFRVINPVIEKAVVDSFYKGIVYSLTKTREYYKRTSRHAYKREIILISNRIKELNKMSFSKSNSGYLVYQESFQEIIQNGITENANSLIVLAKNNLIGLPEKAEIDLEEEFVGIFFVLLKEKMMCNDDLNKLLSFDVLKTTLSVSFDTSRKIDDLIYNHINISKQLNEIKSAVSDMPTENEFLEVLDMLKNIQYTLKNIQSKTETSSNKFENLERIYLDIIYNKYKYVELGNIGEVQKSLLLKDIYVDLELYNRIAVTIDSNGLETKMPISEIDDYNASNQSNSKFIITRMSICDVFSRNKRLIISGETGSGKTIVAHFLLCCLSGKNSIDSGYWKLECAKLGEFAISFIPIYISFDLYKQYEKCGQGASGILDYLENEFALQENIKKFFKEKLTKGNVLVIIEDFEYSVIDPKVMSDIVCFIQNFPSCLYCFFQSSHNLELYRKLNAFEGFENFRLADLSVKKMQEFADRYISKVSMVDKVEGFSFFDFYEDIIRLNLMSLAERPYWFSILIILYGACGNVPDSEYSIHSRILDDMLERFYKNIDEVNIQDYDIINKIFQCVAYSLLKNDPEELSISKGQALQLIEKEFVAKKAIGIMEHLKNNKCELLRYNSINSSFVCVHKPLIDILVAKYYLNSLDLLTELVDMTLLNYNIWAHVLKLVCNGTQQRILSYVLFLLLFPIQAQEFTNENCIRIKTALYLLESVDVAKFVHRAECSKLVEDALALAQAMLKKNLMKMDDKIELYKYISIVSATKPIEFDVEKYFTKISAGKVLLGNDALTGGKAYEYCIPYDYYAGIGPVTNKEYQKFLEENEDYILPSDEAGIWNGYTRCVDKRFLNHPVVGVSFNDAIMFCEWISKKISVPTGYRVWLPSDPEWMKMYRGGMNINASLNQMPDRLYPWGQEWKEGYANLTKLQSPLYTTSAIGIFNEGISPYGNLDTCGNVLEWTTTAWGGFNPNIPLFEHPYIENDGREDLTLSGLRITRGGSFLFSEDDAKCSCRLDPESKFPDTGFRIFIVPLNKFN